MRPSGCVSGMGAWRDGGKRLRRRREELDVEANIQSAAAGILAGLIIL